MKKLNKTLIAAALFSLSSAVSAVPILGSIGFTGTYEAEDATSAVVTDLNLATHIDVTSAAVTGTATGDFGLEGINSLSAVTYSDFTFAPAGPVNTLWTVGSFTFNLTNMSLDFQNANAVLLSGIGVISSTTAGLDDTHGEWIFTANASSSSFTFSSSSSAPEPAIALLLGTGLIGFGVARKMRKAA